MARAKSRYKYMGCLSGLPEQQEANMAPLQEHKMAEADGQLEPIMPNCK